MSEQDNADPPDQYEQALEAARDEPATGEVAGMLYDLSIVEHVEVAGEDESWRDVEIIVTLQDEHGRRTTAILKLMRQAGWKPTAITFSQNRISFKQRD